jgi:hypothetical protein
MLEQAGQQVRAWGEWLRLLLESLGALVIAAIVVDGYALAEELKAHPIAVLQA